MVYVWQWDNVSQQWGCVAIVDLPYNQIDLPFFFILLIVSITLSDLLHSLGKITCFYSEPALKIIGYQIKFSFCWSSAENKQLKNVNAIWQCGNGSSVAHATWHLSSPFHSQDRQELLSSLQSYYQPLSLTHSPHWWAFCASGTRTPDSSVT